MSAPPIQGPEPIVQLRHMRQALTLALGHVDSAAIRGLEESERTLVGLVEAYLPPLVGIKDGEITVQTDLAWAMRRAEEENEEVLSLTDAGTRNGLAVAMALALGLDPSDGVIWTEIEGGGGWRLFTVHGFVDFDDFEGAVPFGRILAAPEVNSEPDRARALALAFLHALTMSASAGAHP